MTTNPISTQTTPDAADENLPLMIDESMNAIMRQAIEAVFLKVPEARSIVVTYDYRRDLNDVPSLSKGLWLSADGNEQKSPDSIVGSLGALLQNAAHILDEIFKMLGRLQAQSTEVSKEILEKKVLLTEVEDQLAELEKSILEKKNELKALNEG